MDAIRLSDNPVARNDRSLLAVNRYDPALAVFPDKHAERSGRWMPKLFCLDYHWLLAKLHGELLMRHLLAAIVVCAVACPARGELIDLAPPGQTPMFADVIPFAEIVVQVSEPTFLKSLGLFFDPKSDFGSVIMRTFVADTQPASITFKSIIHQGPETAIDPALGLDWHDTPVDFLLEPGRYFLIVNASAQFGSQFVPGVTFPFPFMFPPDMYAAGPFQVLGSTFGSRPITTLHLARADVSSAAIPEPSSWALAVIAAALCGWRRLSPTRWRCWSA